ncbi:MAG: hypothetical protein OXT09_22130, partial [Myxococcales bacterium]|nr:hypothetical protein [Myxococcales bacterium]
GETARLGFGARLGLFYHFIDRKQDERLGGTVYPEDTPAVTGGAGHTTDSDLEVPVSQKLGGPRLTLPEKGRDRVAPLRNVQSLRLGGDYTRSVQLARPSGGDSDRHVLNTVPSLFLGYGWGTHYNLSAATAGAAEVGFRRYFVDVMLTLEDATDSDPVDDEPAPQRDFVPVGVRIGMEGTMAAFLTSAPGVGFGYSLELGALPGESGVEGYLLVGLGVALDSASGL